jgi:hypothetical protein
MRPGDIQGLAREFPEEEEEEEEEEADHVQESKEEEDMLEEINLSLPDATRIQRAANALYLQPRRRFVKE